MKFFWQKEEYAVMEASILKELGVNKTQVREGLKKRMAGLKNVYWKHNVPGQKPAPPSTPPVAWWPHGFKAKYAGSRVLLQWWSPLDFEWHNLAPIDENEDTTVRLIPIGITYISHISSTVDVGRRLVKANGEILIAMMTLKGGDKYCIVKRPEGFRRIHFDSLKELL